MKHIGQRVKDIRVSRNLKQQAVTDLIGMSLTAYSNIESGKTESITLQRLQQIATALNTNASVILSDLPVNIHPDIKALQNELQNTQQLLQKANQQIENLGGVKIKGTD